MAEMTARTTSVDRQGSTIVESTSCGYLRFRPCQHCGSRKRTLVDAGSHLRGRCVRCGTDLGRPLEREHQAAFSSSRPRDSWDRTEVVGPRAPLVLIVEDDPAMRALLELLLEHAGYAVASAGDGEEALCRLWLTTPDAVVSDVRMPRLDGLGLVRRMRQTQRLRTVPIILFSASETDPAVRDVLHLGGVRHVDKSDGAGSLVRLLSRMVGRPSQGHVARSAGLRAS
jgi:CheY-like chemotaxis protein